MPMKLSRMFTDKRAEVVILGQRLGQSRALEIIRRTDGYFQGKHEFLAWQRGFNQEYCRALDEAFGYPSAERLGRLGGLDDRNRDRLPKIWQRRWGAISLRWIASHQILFAGGFCHPDGSVADVGELEDYPTGPEVLHDLRVLAAAFPDLTMDVAIWCTFGRSMLGFPYTDGLEAAWPSELLARVAEPTVGFLLNAGEVTVVRGFDRRLFAAYELRYSEALEVALQEQRRLRDNLVLEFAFARRDYPGLHDEVLQGWIDKARALGLTR